jgi:hypothetical protein
VKAASLLLIVLIVGIFLATGTPANAHHSFAGTYLLDQTVTIDGTIVQFDIRNPHSFISLEVRDSDGKTSRWGVEWCDITLLTQTGVTKQTLKVGDKVKATGAPSRDAAMHVVLMKTIRRPADGWVWGERPEELIKGYTFPTTAPR